MRSIRLLCRNARSKDLAAHEELAAREGSHHARSKDLEARERRSRPPRRFTLVTKAGPAINTHFHYFPVVGLVNNNHV